MRPILIALLLAALPVAAQDGPLTAEEFESLVEGRTLTYGAAGSDAYGVEHYHPNRRVTWAWIGDDQCLSGRWYQQGPDDDPAICFVYDDTPFETQCWQVFRQGNGLRAVYLGGGGPSVLYELVDRPGSLVCGGVGV